MKLSLVAGTTSKLVDFFVNDSSVTTGAGLTGLVFNTASLTAYYYREGAASAVAMSLATMTLGTWATLGFVVVDGTNMPGCYQLGIPNAALAAGAKSVVIMLKGATNMAPVLMEIELTAIDNQSAATFMTGVNGVAPPTNWNLTSIDASGRLDVIKVAGTTQTARDLGASVLLSSGTGTGQLDFTSGVVKANATQILGTAVSAPATAGILDVNLKNIANAAVSATTAQLGVNVVNLGGTLQTARDIGLSVLIAAGQIAIKKNVALAKLPFTMVSSTDHATPLAGLTITATRSIDGGAFAACTNAPVGVSGGSYYIDLSAADLNGTTIMLNLSGGATADVRQFPILTQV